MRADGAERPWTSGSTGPRRTTSSIWIFQSCRFDRIYIYGDARPIHVSVGPDNARMVVELRRARLDGRFRTASAGSSILGACARLRRRSARWLMLVVSF
jgi:hypothetical protein